MTAYLNSTAKPDVAWLSGSPRFHRTLRETPAVD
jgi:hypothetical protein